jgi:hypothetical protein
VALKPPNYPNPQTPKPPISTSQQLNSSTSPQLNPSNPQTPKPPTSTSQQLNSSTSPQLNFSPAQPLNLPFPPLYLRYLPAITPLYLRYL